MFALPVATIFTVAGAAYAVAIVTQNTKFLVNMLFRLDPNKPIQNQVIRLYVFGVSLAFCAGYAALTAPAMSRGLTLQVLDAGFQVAVAAILGYHLLNADSSFPTPATPPSAVLANPTPLSGSQNVAPPEPAAPTA